MLRKALVALSAFITTGLIGGGMAVAQVAEE